MIDYLEGEGSEDEKIKKGSDNASQLTSLFKLPPLIFSHSNLGQKAANFYCRNLFTENVELLCLLFYVSSCLPSPAD